MDAFVFVYTNKSKKEADTTPESKNQQLFTGRNFLN